MDFIWYPRVLELNFTFYAICHSVIPSSFTSPCLVTCPVFPFCGSRPQMGSVTNATAIRNTRSESRRLLREAIAIAGVESRGKRVRVVLPMSHRGLFKTCL